MMRLGLVAAALVFLGCGSDNKTLTPFGSTDGGTGTSDGPTSPGAKAKIGTYIVLGDSISDGGGTGPFFNDLLLKNNDTLYPNWKGHDLTTKYPGIMYVHAAKQGAITDNYTGKMAGAPLMADQIKGLGNSYPGDILITVTIGGNDLRAASTDVIFNLDQGDRDQLAMHLAAQLGELLMPGRLGSGKVYIIEANIYDATDGQGDWGTLMCGPKVNVMPAQDVTGFKNWNAVINTAIMNNSANDTLFDLYALFNGHGFGSMDPWFVSDCLHPNAKGHNQIRGEVWRIATGEVVQ